MSSTLEAPCCTLQVVCVTFANAQEEEAQTARRLAEQERVRLAGQLRQLQTEQAALEEVWAAKKAAVRLELQKRQAAKQLELQVATLLSERTNAYVRRSSGVKSCVGTRSAWQGL